MTDKDRIAIRQHMDVIQEHLNNIAYICKINKGARLESGGTGGPPPAGEGGG